MDLQKRVFVVPHFHYDLAWISSERANLRKAYKILGRVMDIMERDRDFTYVVDQAFYLEKMKQEEPRLFRRLAERIAEGRVEVVNAGYLMPDLNLVSPFVLKKDFEMMNAFARREFDTAPRVAWMIDCFGSPGIMPRIVRESGLKYYVFWRGMNSPDSGQEFYWTGSDGTSILVHWMKHGYSQYGYRFDNLMKATDELKPTTDVALVPFGADFYVPHEKLIRQVQRTENAKFALPSEFFREVEKHGRDLPTVEGEMLSDYANFRGCYSSRVSFKQLYRRAEKEALGKEATEDEWKNLLYSAFHDLICGTGIDEVYPSAEKKLRSIKTEKKPAREGRMYDGEFLSGVSFELKREEGDLYHTKPSVKVALPQNSVKLEARLNGNTLNLLAETDFQFPGHVLRLVVSTGIANGRLVHHLWKDTFAERKLNTLYAFNDSFEYTDKNDSGLRFASDDCFDYEVKDNGNVYVTLVRSVEILSHGDAGPRARCPNALELGKRRFRMAISSLGRNLLLKS